MSGLGARISGIGYELGEELVGNEVMSSIVEYNVARALGKKIENLSDAERAKRCTSPEWIIKRTGIETRYFADKKTATSDLAARAVLKAVAQSGRRVQDCGFILVATVTPDHLYSPPTASLVQEKVGLLVRDDLGLRDCLVLDAAAACSSFAAALRLGYSLITSGGFNFGMVVGADKMSVTVNFADRAFCILLGDAAAAVTLEAVPEAENSFWRGSNSFFSWSDGNKGENIIAKVGGSRSPTTPDVFINPFERPDKLQQDGNAVFKDMVRLIPVPNKSSGTIIGAALAKAGVSLKEIDLIFFHQANSRILEVVQEKLEEAGFQGIIFNTINRFGNTTSASIPLGMAVAFEEGVLRKGQKVLTCAFGGGYTAGTALFEWMI